MAGIVYDNGGSGGGGGFEITTPETSTLTDFTEKAVASGDFAQGASLITFTAAGGAYAYLRHNTQFPLAAAYKVSFSFKFSVTTGDIRIGVVFGGDAAAFANTPAVYVRHAAGATTLNTESHNTSTFEGKASASNVSADTWYLFEAVFSGSYIGIRTSDLGVGTTAT